MGVRRDAVPSGRISDPSYSLNHPKQWRVFRYFNLGFISKDAILIITTPFSRE
jgi:hypothetical protein